MSPLPRLHHHDNDYCGVILHIHYNMLCNVGALKVAHLQSSAVCCSQMVRA